MNASGLFATYRRCSLIFLPLTLIPLAGCADLAVMLGMRTRLDKLPVTSISASLVRKGSSDPISALAPGESARIVVVANTQDGKRLLSAGAGHGKVLLDSFICTPALLTLGKGGKVTLPSDPRISDGTIASIHIVTVGHPDVATDLDVAPRYDAAFVANYSGANGNAGVDGMAGFDGQAGADAIPSLPDPTTGMPGATGPGGNGSDGGRGGDGGNGGPGSPGGQVQVWLRLKPDSDSVLQAKVTGGGLESYFLIAASGGSLLIKADGGAGGPGGSGGRGGRGGSGGSGTPSGMSGSDGQSGFDGSPGTGGAAGTIAVTVDPAAEPLEGVLRFSNKSGSGVPGLPPVIEVRSIQPLW